MCDFLGRKPSSETQGQTVGTRESLNGRKDVARRKVKNGEKSPWGQCLTRPVPTVAAVLASDWCQKNTSFLAPIRGQNRGDRWNWSGKTLSPGALLSVLYFSSFLIYFSARLHFPSPTLSAPGSPRMGGKRDEALRKSAWQGSEKYAGMLSVRLYIHWEPLRRPGENWKKLA